MGTFIMNKSKIYLYLIRKWSGHIKSRNYVWVHKSVLMSNVSNLPFDAKTLQEIFK